MQQTAYIVIASIQMMLPAMDLAFLEMIGRLKDTLLAVMPLIAAACTGILFLEDSASWAE